jgi:ABC-type antimicrobial peptide transport system permease subunit
LVNAYMYAAVRTSGPPRDVVTRVLERLAAIDREIPLVDVLTLEEIAASRIGGDRRSALALLSIFAAVALLLAAIGIYGVVSFGVRSRSREIGVRMALGASGAIVARSVLRQGLRMTSLGVAVGLLASLLAGRVLASMLWQVTPTDPTILLTVAIVLLATAALASWVPAVRASRLPVVDVLRRN